jgi:hypothetical protein
VAGQRFSQYTPPIKQDSHDITEILLKVALNTITGSVVLCKLSQLNLSETTGINGTKLFLEY